MKLPFRKRDAGATRQAILAAAQRQFARSGPEGTRVDEIAAEARVNKRMIYAYYGSKEGLYRAVLRAHFDCVQELGEAAVAAGADPRVQAEAAIRRYFRFLQENPGFVRLLGWEILGETRHARQALAGRAIGGLEQLHEIVRAGMRQKIFRGDLDVPRLVASVHALCLGHFTHRPILESLWGEDLKTPAAGARALQHIVDLVFCGICRSPHCPRRT